MALTHLNIDNVRNLQQVKLEGFARANVFFGDNGSGKTSVLESIHLLGMARSFRGTSVKSVITHGEAQCTVFGRAEQSLGVQRSRSGEAQIRIGGQQVRTVAELAGELPLQVITADSFGLLTGPPGARRQYLDWGVFHVEQGFFPHWQRFQRCIKQRNSLLRRDKIPDQELSVWTRDLATAGTAINDYRVAYFKELAPRFQAIMGSLSPGLAGVDLHYRQGWDRQLTYAEALLQGRTTDREQGFTHTGPQRADIRVTVDGHGAAETLSRGQQKLVVCALKLAQGQMMAEKGEGMCTYLIDDLPSELDAGHARLVCAALAAMESQVFITCVEEHEIRAVWPEDTDLAVFHVEHGRVVGKHHT